MRWKSRDTEQFAQVEGLPGVHSIWSGSLYEYERPPRLGDRITGKSYLKDVVEKLVRREMAGAADLSVPLDVSVGIGRTWHEAGH